MRVQDGASIGKHLAFFIQGRKLGIDNKIIPSGGDRDHPGCLG